MKQNIKPKTGRWAKGTSGNPSGRPPGSRNQATLAMEQLLEGEGEQLIRKAVELAKHGNIHATRLCLERLLPPLRDRCITLELPPLHSAQDLPTQFHAITAAIAEGRITPGEGESISNVLTSHSKIMELAELDRRVVELEGARAEWKSSQEELRRFLRDQAGDGKLPVDLRDPADPDDT